MALKANAKFVLVSDLEQGRKKTKGGIYLPDIDDLKDEQKPRWCKVYSVGPRSCVVNDIKEGDWILVTYLRWTEGFDVEGQRLWAVEDTAIMMVSETKPEELHEKEIA